jgi:hypothetical protein
MVLSFSSVCSMSMERLHGGTAAARIGPGATRRGEDD